MKHCVLISPADSKLVEKLHENGIYAVFTKSIDSLIEYERYHADIQLLRIHNTAFISDSSLYLRELVSEYFDEIIVCNELSGNYPYNVSLNSALVGNHLICREKSTPDDIKNYCKQKGIKLINVNQGYAKCSTLVVNDNAVITADKGIYNKACDIGIKALQIREGHIRLSGDKYGFIGGSSMRVGDMIFFFGDINTHPDNRIITEFIEREGLKPVSLINNAMLNDVGGAVILK